jgi:site-specific DNA-cytosine methylase
MKVLELFKGSGSITKYYENTDIEVISLDILQKYNPTICSDIMTWDYKVYEPKTFDIIWCSPECKIFSALQYTNIGRKWKSREELDKAREENSIFINKTIEIIEYFKPKFYFIENPRYSTIWDYIENEKYKYNFVIVDYCAFGYNYKKPTKILTNKLLDNVLCSCTGNPKHPMRLGVTSKKFLEARSNIQKKDTTTLNQRYSIPPKLLKYLLE